MCKKKPPVPPVAVFPVVSEPLLLDIPKAARALSCTTWAMRSLLWDGKIPFVKIGRRFLVRPSDLQAYINNQLEGAA